MTVFLTTAAACLAASLLTLGAPASANAADPEGRFRISAEMDGYLTLHADGSMELDAVLASEIFGISFPPSGASQSASLRISQ